MANNNGSGKSLESWIWDAACSIRGAKNAPKYKGYILPLIFTKRLCDVFDGELNRIAKEGVTSHMRAIARENPLLQGIIDRVDFNASQVFEKGAPKNFILAAVLQRIADTQPAFQHVS